MKTDNELIAEFMEFDFVNAEILDTNCEFPFERDMTANDLEYDRSWDWLMPVVERINGVSPEMWYDFTDATHADCPTIFESIKVVYEFVLEFIRWYNSVAGGGGEKGEGSLPTL